MVRQAAKTGQARLGPCSEAAAIRALAFKAICAFIASFSNFLRRVSVKHFCWAWGVWTD